MILITRPCPEAGLTSDVLQGMGYQTQVDPQITIQAVEVDKIEQTDVVIFTSANGVRYAPEVLLSWQPLIYAVGDNTAQIAQNKGFSRVISAGGDVHQLAKLLRNNLQEGTQILHVCGRHSQRGDLENLESAGFKINDCIVYDAIASLQLSHNTCEKLKNNIITSALFFSPRTAKIFVTNLKRSALENRAETVTAYCISQSVAKELDSIRWKKINIAVQPTHAAVISMVQSL